MKIEELLRQLRHRDVTLWTEDGRLRFRAAKEALTPELREELSRRKEEVVAFLEAARQAVSAANGPALVKVPHEGGEPVPLSFAQERMWLLDQLDPGSYAYNNFSPFRIHGPLDLGKMQQAFDEMVRRHESLRTTFPSERGRPAQVIGAVRPVEIPVVDLAGLPPRQRERRTAELVTAEHQRPFDLARGPLMRVVLLRRGAAEHVLLFNLHHVISDGWSMAVAIRELTTLYEAFAGDRPSPLPELPIQYADFAVWQRRQLSGDGQAELFSYWHRQLADRPPPLRLATDRPRASVRGVRLELQVLRLPPPLRAAVEALGAERHTTLFMTLLAAFDVLLFRYTRETDVLVGIPVAGRRHPEVQDLIGFFLNTLVLRSRLRPGGGFRELLDDVRRVTLEAFAHEDLPLELVQKALQEDGEPELFRVMLQVQNVPMPTIEVAGLEFELVASAEDALLLGTDVFDLSLVAQEEEDALLAELAYNGLLFERVTVERLLGHFHRVLEAALADPERPIAELPLLAEAERLEILESSGTAAAGGEDGTPAHRRILAWAERRGDAPAVVWGGPNGGGALTYRELAEAVERLAGHLAGLGVGPEVRVVLWLERSPELVVALLATLRAGGAFVPLDPSIPAERRDLVLADSGGGVVLTHGRLAPRLAGISGVDVVSVDLDVPLDAGHAQPEAGSVGPVAVRPENAAYVIYTSGSTGTPKGVVVEHRQLSAFTAAAAETYGIDAGDRVLQFASISFDTSVEEVFPALTRGAALVLRDEEMLGSAPALASACRRHGVTVLDLPTAFWHAWVAGLKAAGETVGAPLRLVILGGEQADHAVLASWRERADPGIALYNTYGPTEATVVATWSDLSHRPAGERAPIGRPLGAARAWVVDSGLNLSPRGVPGELLLGGPGLARGYLGRPGRTASVFVPDPFQGTPGGRLYRTGDMARLRNDGELEYLGRRDHQVKVRGFRVELGEVEATLRRHPAVSEAVVTVRAGESGPRLIAWVESAVPPAEGELRSFLASLLPDYMVPAVWVILESLPRTPGGKADRAALGRRELPSGDGGRPEVATPYVAPESDAEAVLAEIFAELLGVSRVGVGDDFFELGGHSLLLPQALYRLREAFDVEVPLRDFYDDPTVAGLAELVEDLILDELEAQPSAMEAVE